MRAGHVVRIEGARPRWWNLRGWWRWWRRGRVTGFYRVASVTRTTLEIEK